MTDRPPGIDDMVVTATDVKQAGHCFGRSGARGWFGQQGFTDEQFRSFLKEGINAGEIWDLGDGFAQRIIRLKIERESGR